MLKYIVRCFEYSALGCSVMCIWENQPIYGVWLVLMAIALMHIGDKLEK